MTTATDSNVRITASVAQTATVDQENRRTLYLTNDSATPPTAAEITQQRNRRGAAVFATADAVSAAYPAGSKAREAANIYFQQNPYPRDLVIGTQIAANQRGYVFGVAPTVDEADIDTDIGSTSLVLGGTSVAVDLSSTTTYTGAASAIQAALRAARFDNATTVTVVGGTLVVSVVFDDDIGIGFDDSPHARLLGLFGPDVVVFGGLAAETPVAALDRIQTEYPDWYFLAVDPDIYDTTAVTDIANWVAARNRSFSLDSTQGAALTPNDTTSFSAQVTALQQMKTHVLFSTSADHKALSLAGGLSAINYGIPGSFRTAKFMRLPGTTPDVFTPAQIAELDRKRVNHYTVQHGRAILAEGVAGSGWIDQALWLDWFVGRMGRAVFNAISTGRVPQTVAGMGIIRDTISAVCEQGVASGWLAPGQLSPSLTAEVQRVTGNGAFDGYLSTGYLIHASPIGEQAQSDRDMRISPPFAVWVKGGGALQRVDIAILFEG